MLHFFRKLAATIEIEKCFLFCMMRGMQWPRGLTIWRLVLQFQAVHIGLG